MTKDPLLALIEEWGKRGGLPLPVHRPWRKKLPVFHSEEEEVAPRCQKSVALRKANHLNSSEVEYDGLISQPFNFATHFWPLGGPLEVGPTTAEGRAHAPR